MFRKFRTHMHRQTTKGPHPPEKESGGPKPTYTKRMNTCPACGHEREGHATTNNQPTCSSGHDMGFGDEDMCPCQDPCHGERIVTRTRYLS